MISRRSLAAMLAGGLCAWAWPARAQTFPSRLVRIVVPAVPAGGADILARSISDRLQALWRQTVIVENHTGGAGAVGAHQVMSANPDGYTLLMTATNTMMALVTETDKPYDVTHDLAPVTLVSAPPYLLVANPAVPATNAAELIAYAQQNPGKLTYGSSGVGSASHLSGALFAEMAGIKMLHVPYRGTGAVLVDLLAGRVNLLFSPALTVMPSVKAGELRVIGTTGTTRSALFPQYPTIAESGLPDYSSLGSFGLLAPAATPPGIVAKISADVGTVLRSDEVKERLAKEGAEPAPTTPAEFTSLVNSTIATWIALGRKAGIKFGE